MVVKWSKAIGPLIMRKFCDWVAPRAIGKDKSEHSGRFRQMIEEDLAGRGMVVEKVELPAGTIEKAVAESLARG